MRRTFALGVVFGLMIVAAGASFFSGKQARTSQIVSADEEHGFNTADLDTTCKPCQDFFEYATGGWVKSHPIPPEYASWGRFNALQNHNQEVLRGILEAAAISKAAPGSIEQKVGDFYSACMNTDGIEAAGTKPLEAEFERIAAIDNLEQLQDEVAHLQDIGTRVLFGFGSEQDDKNSQQVIGAARQGGLGLPDRDYYTKQDDKSKMLREQYVQHITKMMQLVGDAPEKAGAEARTVLNIETQMAQASKTRVERRDPEANYHKMDPAQLHALTPDFSWETYFRNIGFPNIHQVNVGQPEFFQALDKQLKSVSIPDWKTYLRWHFILSAAPALPGKFVEENFNFYGRTLTGAKEIQPRWKRCVTATDRNLGEAVGQKYVEKVFPPQAKQRAHDMVENLVSALHADIETLPWMSDPTRKQALAKLAAMNLKIGYPDKWRDYSAYQVTRDSYLDDLQRGSAFEFHRRLAKIDKPVDRNEWDMSPPTVNAYYDSNMNEIVFPAGILQPPFFDAQADDALNYGGIGAVIGHEMTHGFDDQGAQYDAQGNLHNWWTPEDLKNFKERTACVEKQFDSFVVANDLHENGKLVLGESIADLGGVTLAHMAFDNTPEGKANSPAIDGFTPEQRFFLSFARIWGTTARPEYERMMTTVDPHPLPRFRAKGALLNTPAFARAFDCHAGDAMVNPADQICKIW
jgi:predicted metalloendopeptidase